MTEPVDATKDAAADTAAVPKNAGMTAVPASPKDGVRPGKAASVTAALSRRVPSLPLDTRMAVVATVALVVGSGFGMLSAPHGLSSEALVRIEADLEAGRTETVRLNMEIERLGRTLSAIRETGEAARGESKVLGATIGERLGRTEQNLDRKIAALTEKLSLADHETGTPLVVTTAQPERRTSAPVTVAPSAAPATTAATTARPEPTQTASLPDTKPRTDTVETWALRDVYDGVAMLEDRKRRLVEVVPGDAVPGIGRVESIERRGRTWVVVTRQGLITPQMW